MIILYICFIINYGSEVVFSIPLDSVGVRVAPGAIVGPQSFYFGEKIFYLLDTESGNVKKYSRDGKFVDAFEIPPFSRDIWVQGENIFILTGRREVEEFSQEGKEGKSHPFPEKIKAVVGIRTDKQGNVQILDISGDTYNINGAVQKGYPGSKGDYYFIEKLGRYNARIQGINIETQKEIGGLQYIGDDENGNIYLLIEYLIQIRPIKVKREIRIYSKNGELISKISVPSVTYTYIFREFQVTPQGIIYELFTSKDSLIIIRFAAEIKGNYRFPPVEKWLPTIDERNSFPLKSGEKFPRDLMLSIADSYVSHTFIADSINLTFGDTVYRDGNGIATPEWLVVGENKAIPYKWGGFSSITEFDGGLSASKYCGDRCCDGWGSSYAIGVDCSGFVSRCWGLTSKYSTSTIPNISTPYETWDALRPGDCFNWPGRHVILCVEESPSGAVFCVESSGLDWKVSYRVRNYSSLTNYTPRFYNGVEGYPFVVKVIPSCTPVREGPYSTSSVIDLVKANNCFVAFDRTGNGWYRIHLPSWRGNGYNNFGFLKGLNENYLIGDQDRRWIEVKSFKGSLAVKRGPGASYPTIATIRTGQRFAVIDSSGDWYEIWLPGSFDEDSVGWCLRGAGGEYLKVWQGGPTGTYKGEIIDFYCPDTMISGELVDCFIRCTNLSDVAWDSSTQLGTASPRDRESAFYDSSWISTTRLTRAEFPALPGQIVDFSFRLKAPVVEIPTTYNEYMCPVEERYSWFSDSTCFTITVLPPSEVAETEQVAADFSLRVHPNPFTTRTTIDIGRKATDQKIEKSSISGLRSLVCIYDLSGRLVKRFAIHDSQLTSIVWNGTDEYGAKLPAGVYFCKLVTPNSAEVRKMTLLR